MNARRRNLSTNTILRLVIGIILVIWGVSSYLLSHSLQSQLLRSPGSAQQTLKLGEKANLQTSFKCFTRVQNHLSLSHQSNIGMKIPLLTSTVDLGDGNVVAIFATKHIHDTYNEWANKEWICNGQKGIVKKKDPHLHTLIIYCRSTQIPLQIHLKDAPQARYLVHEHCTIPVTATRLSACTMIKGNSRELLPQWIAYHRAIGFEQILVYVNEPMDAVVELLDAFIHKQSVVVIPFDFDVNIPFYFQQAMQNDCIYRMKGRSKWVALHDVDEYFYVIPPNQSLLSMLTGYEKRYREKIGGVQVPNWFYGCHPSAKSKNCTLEKGELLISKFQFRAPSATKKGREKVVTRPENVDYFSVHMITSGKHMARADAVNHVRLVHFRRPEKGVFGYYRKRSWYKLVQDSSLFDRHARMLEKELERLQSREKPSVGSY